MRFFRRWLNRQDDDKARMNPDSSESRRRLERARDKLVARYIYHPDVTLIDIGYPLNVDTDKKQLVLRIHVRGSFDPDQQIAFPEELDGIPVIVMSGDYRLE